MNFADLHERLRLELVRRINADTLTGSRLAQQTGFRQAHISNFLNRKRALSLDGLDRVLAAQNLTIDQILPSENIAISASADEDHIENVPVVSPYTAIEDAAVTPEAVVEYVPVSTALLRLNRSRGSKNQASWRRFVALRADAQQASALAPLIHGGSVVIIDRHYTSLAPYRSQQPNLYAIRRSRALEMGFAGFNDGHLIVRPNSVLFPVQLIPVHPGQNPSDLIVGRVCLVFNEL